MKRLRARALLSVLGPGLALFMAFAPSQAWAATYGGNDWYSGPGALANENSAGGGDFNAAFGVLAMNANTTGNHNSAFGSNALENFNGSGNTATGAGALEGPANASGWNNTADGTNALFRDDSGAGNVGIGAFSLNWNANGNNNVGVGAFSLDLNSSGNDNTSVGTNSLYSNSGGSENTAVGEEALYSNVNGLYNTAVGSAALVLNDGLGNTGIGDGALTLSTASYNTAVGNLAGNSTTTGGNDSAFGNGALFTNTTGSLDSAFGDGAGNGNESGNADTFLGADAVAGSGNLSNATAVGAGATVTESNALVLGNAVNVGIGTSTPNATLDVVGKIQSTDLTVTNTIQGSITGNAASVTNGLYSNGSYTDPSWLSSLSAGKITGVLAAIDGGTGLSSPGAQGNFLRSAGNGNWVSQGFSASDVPAGSNNYIQNNSTTTPQASAGFNIDGNGILGGALTVTGTASSSIAANLGVGNSNPQSLVQIGKPSTSYGQYLQLPLVSSSSGPPASQCNTTTYVGRIVMQYNANGSTTNRTTMWVCLPSGVWSSH